MPRPTPASETEQLTLKMAAGLQSYSAFAEEFAREFPVVRPAFPLLESINEKVRELFRNEAS